MKANIKIIAAMTLVLVAASCKNKDDRMPGMTLFFKSGEPIALPPGLWIDTGREIEATVHPIGVD